MEEQHIVEADPSTVPQDLEERNQLLLGYGLVLNQLLQSEKFRMFVETYYTIQKVLNEEEKSIELRVIENPPEVILERMQGEVAKAEAAEPKIEIVSGARAKQVVKMAEAKAKKDRERRR